MDGRLFARLAEKDVTSSDLQSCLLLDKDINAIWRQLPNTHLLRKYFGGLIEV